MRILISLAFSLCYVFIFAQGTWEKKADYPGCFTHSQIAFSVGGKGIVGLGAAWCIEIWEYDPEDDVWTQKNDFIGDNVSDRPASFSVGDRGFVTLGGGDDQFYSPHLWEYDQANDTWMQRASFPGPGRGVPVSFVIGDKAYVGGGAGIENDEYVVFTDFYAYTPATDTWEVIADFPIPISGSVGFSAGGKGFVGSGSFDGEFVNTFFAYDPSQDEWTQIDDLPREEPTVLATGFSIQNQGYFGMGLSDAQKFYEYDPFRAQWFQKADYPDFRAYDEGIGFSIGDIGYMGLGDDITGETFMNNSFYAYTPDSIIVSKTNTPGKELVDFVLYPNPVSDHDNNLYAEFAASGGMASVSICDVNGQVIRKHQGFAGKHMRFEVLDLSPGIYFVHLLTDDYYGIERFVKR